MEMKAEKYQRSDWNNDDVEPAQLLLWEGGAAPLFSL